MKVVDDDGSVLDATFQVVAGKPIAIRYEQAGGGAGRARNRDYTAGLIVLLRRLRVLDVVIQNLEVQTSRTAALPPIQRRMHLARHELPIDMRSVRDIADLKTDITTAARAPGARPGAAKGGASRTLLITLDDLRMPSEVLGQRLAGRGTIDEIAATREVVAMAAGRTSDRQGFLISSVAKRAVEMHAMQCARSTLENEGWEVEDVSGRKPCDLECRRSGESLLHVEVKGTTTQGDIVLVTRNEVEHARANHPETLLFIVYGIHLEGADTEAPVASQGQVRRVAGWAQDEKRLRSIGFEYDAL